jgi:preprotein translocase subunit SecG
MGARLKRLQSLAGIDYHVGLTLLFRSWGIVAGAVMVFAIPMTLSPQQQGYYFTFSSLLGLQIFFELGLNQVVVQLVSHEMAGLSLAHDGTAQGDSLRIDRIKSIVSVLRRWYAVAAALFLVVTITVGAILFERAGTIPAREWLGPWALLVGVAAINLYHSPMLAVVEGCGNVGQVARLRFVQSVAGYGLTWLALFAGAGLWAIPLIAGAAGLCTSLWLRAKSNPIRAFSGAARVAPERSVDWRREVLPFQWRIALSWVSGYLLFQLFTPLAFVHLGPVVAGQLGISLAIFGAIQSVGISWINAKLPTLTALASRAEWPQLRASFDGLLKRAMAFTSLGSAAIVLGAFGLSAFGVQQLNRLADLPTLACMALTTATNTAIYGAASYMRAHREEPMLPVSLTTGALTLVAVYFASRHSALATMLAQAVVTLGISLPWTLLLFKRYRSRGVA